VARASKGGDGLPYGSYRHSCGYAVAPVCSIWPNGVVDPLRGHGTGWIGIGYIFRSRGWSRIERCQHPGSTEDFDVC
jgi:hypothetical protein